MWSSAEATCNLLMLRTEGQAQQSGCISISFCAPCCRMQGNARGACMPSSLEMKGKVAWALAAHTLLLESRVGLQGIRTVGRA